MTKRMLSLLLVLVAVCSSGLASAQEDLDKKREQARPIALAGFELLQAGKYNEAIAKLEEAERLFHAPTHLLYIGQARKELGELLTAYDTFVDIVIEDIPNYAPPQFQQAKVEAKREADALRSKIATAVITVSGVRADRVTVTIDGTPVPQQRLVHPIGITEGSHTIVASADGVEPVSETVEGIAGQSATVSLTLAPRTAAEPDDGEAGEEGSFPVVGTIVLALGAGALIAGAVTGVVTLNEASAIKDRCSGTVCPLASEQEADDAKLIGNVSTAMFVAGGVLAVAGIVLVIVDPFGGSEPAAAALGARVGPTGAALFGTF